MKPSAINTPDEPRIDGRSWKLRIVRIAPSGWGYDRIVSALANSGYRTQIEPSNRQLQNKSPALLSRLPRAVATSWKVSAGGAQGQVYTDGFFTVEVLEVAGAGPVADAQILYSPRTEGSRSPESPVIGR